MCVYLALARLIQFSTARAAHRVGRFDITSRGIVPKGTISMENKERKLFRAETRQMIANVYNFLKTEYEFMESHMEPNCDLSHLRNIEKRTAEATEVSESIVQQILREERENKKVDKDLNGASDIKESKKRKILIDENRQIIASVYYFLKIEYEFTKTHKEPNADYSHLRNIAKRTAEAAGVCERTVQKVLKEKRDDLSTAASDNKAVVDAAKDSRRNRIARFEGRPMIDSVCHLAQVEFEDTESNQEPNSDLSHLKVIEASEKTLQINCIKEGEETKDVLVCNKKRCIDETEKS